MAYICSNPATYRGRVVGNGECVRFVQTCAGAPSAATWRPGRQIKGADHIATGTAIATFIDGVYPNGRTGNHAAIYVSHDDRGIVVWDQWRGQAVHQRTIRYKEGDTDPSNDGDFFYVIE